MEFVITKVDCTVEWAKGEGGRDVFPRAKEKGKLPANYNLGREGRKIQFSDE